MPTQKPSELPSITSLAARVRDGEATQRSLAAEYGVALATIQNRFSYAGFASTGESMQQAQARELRTALASAVKVWWQPWMDGAVCAQTDPESFFPEKGCSTREAKRVCLGCDVREQCLEWALANGERFGIFGGTSERERRKIEKQRKAAA